MGELKYFPLPSEGGVYAELPEARSMVMTQGDATTGVEDLSVRPGAGVLCFFRASSALVPRSLALSQGRVWLEQGGLKGWGIGPHTMPDAVGKHTVLHFPWVWSMALPSLPGQLHRPRTGGQEMRREERRGEEGLFPTELSYILTQHLRGAAPDLSEVRCIGEKSSCPDSPSTWPSLRPGGSGAMCW